MRLLYIFVLFIALAIPFNNVNAGFPELNGGDFSFTLTDTDTSNIRFTSSLVYFFDMRDRETFIQLTYPDRVLGDDDDDLGTGVNATAHVQIFNVENNCNENDFFDVYTPADTHTYDMKDILTNDGNPSGVVLPDNAYGIVVVTVFRNIDGILFNADPIGNMRILDNNGYEYRTNAQALFNVFTSDVFPPLSISNPYYSFNFNNEDGVTLSDVVGITLYLPGDDDSIELAALPVQGIYSPFDIDIYDLNEVPFSCRDIIFSCVDDDNPLLEEVLSVAGTASVASFEYGINNAIPHSKGGELLCPGNIIDNGTVTLIPERYTQAAADLVQSLDGPTFYGFVGLNNGNGRGSLDSFNVWNLFLFGGS